MTFQNFPYPFARTMEKLNLGYSLKNIPIPNFDQYQKILIGRTEEFIQKLRWRAHFFLNPTLKPSQNETFGFKTSKTAPQVKELAPFENDLLTLISNVKFNNHRSEFQRKLNKDIRTIKSNSKILVPADKTTNLYAVPVDTYRKLLTENITRDYKKTEDNMLFTINEEARSIARKLELDDRIETYCQKPAYITLKDHKENFINNPKCRLINPAKSEIGKISKIILQAINTAVREKSKLRQWQSTGQVLEWFDGLQNKKKLQFLQLDICEFYPSITENLLDKALDYAANLTNIDQNDREIIKHSRKAFLFSRPTMKMNSPERDQTPDIWTKKDGLFDVTMGAPDGAEVCETVGLFILHKMEKNFPQINFGLYRDDGLAAHTCIPGPTLNRMQKNIIQLFKQYNLKITIETNMKRVDFLDVRLDLETNKYTPYRKPNDYPLYVHKHSNHPPSVIKQIPISINKRLSTISSNKEEFDKEKNEYQKALQNSGYQHKLEYDNTAKSTTTDEKKKKNRNRKITWYNPPYCAAVTTNIGRQFLNLIDTHFPKKHKLHKIINRNSVKIGYSCTKNVKAIIQSHNNNVLTKDDDTLNKRTTSKCNCRNKETCPLDRNCQQEDVIYEATIDNPTKNETKKYIGSTTNFKYRFSSHKSSFNHVKHKNATTLSNYMWDNNLSQDNIKWKILKQAPSYKQGQKFCDLCLTEKLAIARTSTDPAYLNKRFELAQKCRHKIKYKLATLKPKAQVDLAKNGSQQTFS